MAQPHLAPERVVVVGSGLMARGIAAALVATGFSTAVASRDLSRARAAADEAARRGRGEPPDAYGMAPAAFAGADFVIESVIEDHRAKEHVLSQVESWVADDALIGTNTSSLRVEDLATTLNRPARFLGLHFLNPAELTAVVEVVPSPVTSRGAVARAEQFVRLLGKEPLLVRKDAPGFIWNRLQFALIREALSLAEEGIADPEDIDRAVTHGLAPRWLAAGPLATVDLGGAAVFRAAAENLFPELAAGISTIERLRSAEEGRPLRRWKHGELASIAALRDRWLQTWRRLTSEV